MADRVTKYRAWVPKDKRMVYDALVITPGEVSHRACVEGPFDVVWLEFTGLKDKRGVEVHEGDILKGVSGNKQIVGPVKHIAEKGCSAFYWVIDKSYGYDVCHTMDDCEVIGNVHEHPHLLENKK